VQSARILSFDQLDSRWQQIHMLGFQTSARWDGWGRRLNEKQICGKNNGDMVKTSKPIDISEAILICLCFVIGFVFFVKKYNYFCPGNKNWTSCRCDPTTQHRVWCVNKPARQQQHTQRLEAYFPVVFPYCVSSQLNSPTGCLAYLSHRLCVHSFKLVTGLVCRIFILVNSLSHVWDRIGRLVPTHICCL
jgi:hypothetical protein